MSRLAGRLLFLETRCPHVLPNMLRRDEELRPQVFLRHGLMVQDRQRSDPRQDKVLGHFIRQGLEGDQENLGRPQSAKISGQRIVSRLRGGSVVLFLRLHAPEADLTVV